MAITCHSCFADLLPDDRFCRSCGTPVQSASEMATRLTAGAPVGGGALEAGAAESDGVTGAAADRRAVFVSSPVGRLISSSSVAVGGFAPGAILAGRYRIIGLLGRGGMGEVYRADDLKLGQAVALKFLPRALADDPVRRERFFAEVRIARQVSHPNICRVYDIGEIDVSGSGPRHFLTMEYVDGEDLASLLKRIGHLHGAKALDIARQLCAGLAAAHDRGVLHRDLKPANVMLDGRGHVRITDFGLAVAAGEDAGSWEMSGTPAYMAPEQFAGHGASVRSDIYALGLVLYEIYTGRRAFEAPTLADLRANKETPPTAPSEIARDIDPVVERVIMRCLEKDPRQRPSSVVQVAAALPGGDPLAAALAAGETPSPEMVAASGSKDALRPAAAWACLAVTLVCLAVGIVQGRSFNLLERVPVGPSNDVLQQTARTILSKAGYREPFADSVSGFSRDNDFFTWTTEQDKSPSRWERLPDSSLAFWYRQSPAAIVAWTFPGVQLSATDPVPATSGESLVMLDSRGQLIGLRAVPPERDPATAPAPEPDWNVLFEAAGFDRAKWTETAPTWTPLLYADKRVAWTGTIEKFPGLQMRIEAASYRGKPVAWTLVQPWTKPSRMAATTSWSVRATGALGVAVLLLLVAGGAAFARRNVRMGRGDRRGAARLAKVIAAVSVADMLASVHHVAEPGEIYLLAMVGSAALFIAGFTWLLYVALEPYVRRRWPQALVSWNRLLAGDFRDPVVGRDILVGCLWSSIMVCLQNVGRLVSQGVGEPPLPLMGSPVVLAYSGIRVVDLLIWNFMLNTFFGLAVLFLLFFFRVVTRRQWAAAAIFLALGAAPTLPLTGSFVFTAVDLVYWAAILFVLTRFGLLCLIAGVHFAMVFRVAPITTNLSAWYSGMGMVVLAGLLALLVFAFYTSVGGRPVFGGVRLED